MKNCDLIKILQERDPNAKVEFVFFGNHFDVEGLVHFDPTGYNAIELYGKALHEMEIVVTFNQG